MATRQLYWEPGFLRPGFKKLAWLCGNESHDAARQLSKEGNLNMEKSKMLTLYRKDGTPIGSFGNFGEVYLHIAHQEELKCRDDHSESWKRPWSFQVLSPERVGNLINTLNKTYDEGILLEAWNRRLGLIEICEGKYPNVYLRLLEPGVSVEILKEDWCIDYCIAHEMDIRKT
jgi:hypothetical protein